MANRWFRLYAEILNDPKVQIVTEALRWRYVALLCLQCNGMYENSPDDEIALSLRVTLDEWLDTKKIFISRRLLDEDGKIRSWEKRQYISDLKDPTAAKRQKRYRDRKRNDRNATVTSRLPESETEKKPTVFSSESETETELKEKTYCVSPKEKIHRPQNFSPPSLADIQAYCRETASAVDCGRFYDHYSANGWKVGKNPMKDWKAAFRNWGRGGNGMGAGAFRLTTEEIYADF